MLPFHILDEALSGSLRRFSHPVLFELLGIKVWLPLHLREDQGKNKGFLSKRIMLPFAADIYPLGG